MIKTYKLELKANQGKKDKILSLMKVYRKTAKIVLNEQIKLFYTTSKLNKNHKLDIDTKLSARYLQTLQYQIVSMLNSYLSNHENEFRDIVTNSSLDKDTKIKLYYINKYHKWFNSEVISIFDKKTNKATLFDYWIKLATLDKGKPILLPIKSNRYYENIKGVRKNFCQINYNK